VSALWAESVPPAMNQMPSIRQLRVCRRSMGSVALPTQSQVVGPWSRASFWAAFPYIRMELRFPHSAEWRSSMVRLMA
jgi:hypothetical protein